jgi:hypothetical protein
VWFALLDDPDGAEQITDLHPELQEIDIELEDESA